MMSWMMIAIAFYADGIRHTDLPHTYSMIGSPHTLPPNTRWQETVVSLTEDKNEFHGLVLFIQTCYGCSLHFYRCKWKMSN